MKPDKEERKEEGEREYTQYYFIYIKYKYICKILENAN